MSTPNDEWNTFLKQISYQNQTNAGKQEKLYKKFIKKFKLIKYINSSEIILITGTNGKTTTAKLLYRYLIKYINNRCGLFISPHLLRINERIQGNGRLIKNDELIHLWHQIKDFCLKHQVIYFTSLFFMSLIWFKKNCMKYLIIECGIGAKDDVTVNLPNKAGIITSIDMDHKDLLGNSLHEIAKNKIAVMKQNGIVFVNEFRQSICEFYRNNAIKCNAKIHFLKKTEFASDSKKCEENFFNYQINFNKINVSLATIAIKQWIGKSISIECITNSMLNLLPNIKKYCYAKNHLTFYFLTSHNPAAVANSLYLYRKKLKINFIIFSSLLTKDYIMMLKLLNDQQIPFIILLNFHNLSITEKKIPKKYKKNFRSYKEIFTLKNKNILVIGTNQLTSLILNLIRTKC